MDDEYLTLGQAARLFGVSHQTLWRRTKAGTLLTYQADLNRRVKLVKRSDVEELMRPRAIAGDEGKVAA